MRLIDADRLKRQVEGRSWRAKEKFIELIDASATIESQTVQVRFGVKHGRWEWIGGYGYQYRCSKCYMCADRIAGHEWIWKEKTMRLIDGDALREAMYHEAFETDSDMQKWDSGCWIRYKMFENAIKAAPTIEAEPVKHGRWEHGKEISRTMLGNETIAIDYEDWHCSVCGRRYKEYVLPYRYCPNCGAKMDEEEPHEQN